MKRLSLLLGICIVSQIAVAQCKPTITLSISGCSGSLDGRVAERVAESLFNHYMERAGIGFSSKQECDAFVNSVRSELNNLSTGNCKIRVNVSPCMGCAGSFSGDVNVIAIGQGRSFYSTNSANEIKNWSEDDMERMIALNPEYKATSPTELSMGSEEMDLARNKARQESVFVLDTSKPFRSLNVGEDGQINTHSADLSMRDGFNKVEMSNDFSLMANKENVDKYVDYCRNLSDLFLDLENPYYGDLTMLLHQKFKEASKAAGQEYDLDAIMQKLASERSEAEKQALIDYQEFRKQVTDKIISDIDDYVAKLPETKNFEMAVLAEDCYKDSGHSFLLRTNYKEVHSDFFEEGSQMHGLSELIDELNATNEKTGFHAERYYNEKTNEYTIAFEGTNSDEIWNDIIKADAKLGLGGIPEQYKLAYRIAEYINNPNFPTDVKINFTGHSLGGGLASLVGIVTNKPTFTYNAAGVNKNITDAWGLTEKIERKEYNNIRAFQSEKDQLTSVQEGKLKPVAVSLVVGIVSVVSPPKGGKLLVDAATSRAAAPAVGNKEKVWNDKGHSIVPMVSYLAYSNSKYESIKKDIYEKGHGVEFQTQESIQIFTGL